MNPCPICLGEGIEDLACTSDPDVMVEVRCEGCGGAGEVWPMTYWESLVYSVDATPDLYMPELSKLREVTP